MKVNPRISKLNVGFRVMLKSIQHFDGVATRLHGFSKMILK
jgi:hypothetical protein